jgi:hypothetical protein
MRTATCRRSRLGQQPAFGPFLRTIIVTMAQALRLGTGALPALALLGRDDRWTAQDDHALVAVQSVLLRYDAHTGRQDLADHLRDVVLG